MAQIRRLGVTKIRFSMVSAWAVVRVFTGCGWKWISSSYESMAKDTEDGTYDILVMPFMYFLVQEGNIVHESVREVVPCIKYNYAGAISTVEKSYPLKHKLTTPKSLTVNPT